MEFAEMTKQKRRTIFSSALLAAALVMLLQLVPHASAAGGKTNVLVYMVASDLESHDQAATKDIKEMLSAAKSFGEDVRLIVYAGGAEQWHNDIFSSEENRCVKMDKNGAELLYAEGTRDMTDPMTLADFIKYCGEDFPADRNILIMWDHGGGFFGFGADELNDYKKPMSPLEMFSALGQGGTHFDFIGFDACSMASFEVAYSICDFADYMVASEEMEPLCGWNYKAWLSILAKNSSLDSVEICRSIADSYMDMCRISAPGVKHAASVIDLKVCLKSGHLLSNFSKEMTDEILSGTFDIVSMQRAINSNMMNVDQANMIDVIEFSGSLNFKEAKELNKLLKQSVVYHRKYPEDLKKNGMTIYVPINTDVVSGVYLDDVETMRDMGISEDYLSWVEGFRKYSKLVWHGNKRERTLMDVVNGTVADDYEQAVYDAVSKTTLDVTECYITADENNMPLLIMPNEQKRLTLYICQNVYREIDGETVNFGAFHFEPEDFPIVFDDFWKTMRDDWLFINGTVCPFFMEEKIQLPNGSTAIYGYTQMFRNGDEGALFLRMLYDDSKGTVVIEPICFQEKDFSRELTQFGRIVPVSDIDSDDSVYFFCLSEEDSENSAPVTLTDDMKWGDLSTFELKEPDAIDGFSGTYCAIDLYQNIYNLDLIL